MSVHAEGEYTTADFWRASRVAGRGVLVVTAVGGFFLLAMAVLLTLTGKETRLEDSAWFAIALFFIIYPRAAMFYRSRRSLTQSPMWQGRVLYDFDDDGFTYRGPRASSLITWKAVVKWKETRTLFLFYVSPRSSAIVPKRFLRAPADADAIRELLRLHVVAKAKAEQTMAPTAG